MHAEVVAEAHGSRPTQSAACCSWCVFWDTSRHVGAGLRHVVLSCHNRRSAAVCRTGHVRGRGARVPGSGAVYGRGAVRGHLDAGEVQREGGRTVCRVGTAPAVKRVGSGPLRRSARRIRAALLPLRVGRSLDPVPGGTRGHVTPARSSGASPRGVRGA